MERDRVMRSFLSASPSQYAQVHRLSSGEAILLPDADEVYAALTQRNRGLIGSAEQQTLRQAAILIAGCGGIGGAAIEPLVRAGAETFVLADNGEYAYEDANRENLRIQDVGRNKAQVFAQRMPDINPYARFELRDDGVNERNVERLAATSDIIVDGLSGADIESLRAKLLLHVEARRNQTPVVCGYELAGTIVVVNYDYRIEGMRLLDGKVQESELEDLRPLDFLSRLLSPLKIPLEIVPEYQRHLLGQTLVLPVLGQPALIFGALAVRTVLDMLMQRPVRSSIVIDVPSEVRPRRERLRMTGRRLATLYVLTKRMRSLRKSGRLGVYSPLDDAVFAEMRGYMEERVWEAGSVIVRQGDVGHDFFVVVDGSVQVEREDIEDAPEPVVIATLGPGDYFGELALLLEEPRNASVVAASRCRVLSLSREAFDAFLEESMAARTTLPDVARTRTRRDS